VWVLAHPPEPYGYHPPETVTGEVVVAAEP
jgi:hypothetical protein